MGAPLDLTYHPLADLGRTESWPLPLQRREPVFVPIAGRPPEVERQRLRMMALRWSPIASFTVSDHALLRLAETDPLGLDALAGLPLEGAVTMDVPLYAFFSDVQKERALARLLWLHVESLEAFDRLGLRCIPLVKGLRRDFLDYQLSALKEQGVSEAAFYARELLLEGGIEPVLLFVRLARRHGIRPILLGSARPHRPDVGPIAVVSLLHAVAAWHGERIDAGGRRVPVGDGFQSAFLDRWIPAGDVPALCGHNLLSLRHRLATTGDLLPFGG